jgi:hypothetical protein
MAKPKAPKPALTVSFNGNELKPLSEAVKDILLGNERPYIITVAKIKDDYCHYSFEITKGVEAGAEHAVKIDNEITEDLRRAFEKFHVHLAVIDDVFKHAGVEIDDIDKFHGNQLTMLYHVSGFQIYGSDADESVILLGSKSVSEAGGRIDIKTPKIPIDGTSSYTWYNELSDAVSKARLEVSLYKEGKFVVPEPEEEKPNPKQLTISDSIAQNAQEQEEDEVDVFETAKV